jgi:hypothetical protein
VFQHTHHISQYLSHCHSSFDSQPPKTEVEWRSAQHQIFLWFPLRERIKIQGRKRPKQSISVLSKIRNFSSSAPHNVKTGDYTGLDNIYLYVRRTTIVDYIFLFRNLNPSNINLCSLRYICMVNSNGIYIYFERGCGRFYINFLSILYICMYVEQLLWITFSFFEI